MPLRRVSHSSFHVSEPPPSDFGNRYNQTHKGWTNNNWLRSLFHFSFAEYESERRPFGVLRVMNDDLIQPERGFGPHPHRNMEIVTYVVEGELTHQDSTGVEETLPAGSIQYMSAGEGVMHSEKNLHESDPLRVIQTWIEPREHGIQPRYGSTRGPARGTDQFAGRVNRLCHLVSDMKSGEGSTPACVNQDVNIYVTHLDPGCSVVVPLADRQAYVVCVTGAVTVTGDIDGAPASEQLGRHDAAELTGPMEGVVTGGAEGGHVLVFEMARKDYDY